MVPGHGARERSCPGPRPWPGSVDRLEDREVRERDVFGREAVALLTAEEAAAVDREVRERRGVPERVLMENAGRSAAQVLDRLYPRGRVVAAVGGGHNGGDALVLLRTLRAWGREVAYVAATGRAPDPELLHDFTLEAVPVEDAGAAFLQADVIVDGILGTGSRGAPREPVAGVIRAMNGSGRPIIALDLPSGIDPTTGEVPGEAVRAAVTVTFGWPKRGLLHFPARSYCGRLVAVEIGFPPLAEDRASGALITPAWAAARLPIREPGAHKTKVGRVLVLAGREGMAGAAAVATHAALRAGAGYLRVASSAANREILQSLVPEALFVDRADREALAEAAGASDALVAGPALGVDDVAREILDRVLEAMPGAPALLDADALTLLAGDGEALRRIASERPLLLTPHPGEMSRLTGRPIPEILADPHAAATGLAERIGSAVLLKGAPSIVAAPGEPVLVNTVGSSDLATAGMGDQLSGTAGAFLAAGATPRVAAALALFYAGRAADLAAMGRSLGPREVSEMLARSFADPGPSSPPLGLPFVTFDQPPRW